jgi:hypothetical protein
MRPTLPITEAVERLYQSGSSPQAGIRLKTMIQRAFATFETCSATGTATVWNWKWRRDR